MDKSNYYLIGLINTLIADPITAMSMNSKYVLIGTMKGQLTLLNIQEKTKKILIELSNEHIAFLSINGESIYASIGDEEVFEYQEKTIEKSSAFKKYPLYRNDIEHNKHCQNSHIMMSGSILLRIDLTQGDDSASKLELAKCDFEYKQIQMKKTTQGTIEMTTYSVPFDFDGKRLLWVEFYSKNSRKICVSTVPKGDRIWKYELSEKFGHISQAKLLKDNRVFIVRKMTHCEIRRIDQSFTLEASFENIGYEVISVFIYYYESNHLNTEVISNKVQIYPNLENYFLKMTTNNNKPKESEVIINELKRKAEDNLLIVLLDVDGNINHFENNSITTKFNMYALKEIRENYKEKQFFIMGYPYYIQYHQGVYCISSDHGCYVFADKQLYH